MFLTELYPNVVVRIAASSLILFSVILRNFSTNLPGFGPINKIFKKNSSEFGVISQISEKVVLSKFLGKNPLNFAQQAAAKFVRKFVRFSRENWKIKILKTFSENLLIRPSPGANPI